MKLVVAYTHLVGTTVALFKVMTKYPETGKAKRLLSGPFRRIHHWQESLTY